LLDQLSRDPNVDVRYDVAVNSACPSATLGLMLQDEDGEVSFAVSCRPDVPAAVLAMWQLVYGTH